jgi:hypothetical protein
MFPKLSRTFRGRLVWPTPIITLRYQMVVRNGCCTDARRKSQDSQKRDGYERKRIKRAWNPSRLGTALWGPSRRFRWSRGEGLAVIGEGAF